MCACWVEKNKKKVRCLMLIRRHTLISLREVVRLLNFLLGKLQVGTVNLTRVPE